MAKATKLDDKKKQEQVIQIVLQIPGLERLSVIGKGELCRGGGEGGRETKEKEKGLQFQSPFVLVRPPEMRTFVQLATKLNSNYMYPNFKMQTCSRTQENKDHFEGMDEGSGWAQNIFS